VAVAPASIRLSSAGIFNSQSAPGPAAITTSIDPEPPREIPHTLAWRLVGLAMQLRAVRDCLRVGVVGPASGARTRVVERLQEQFRAGDVPSQRLLLPVPIELDPIAASLLLDRLSFLNAHGLRLLSLAETFFGVEGVPAWMEPAMPSPFSEICWVRFEKGIGRMEIRIWRGGTGPAGVRQGHPSASRCQ